MRTPHGGPDGIRLHRPSTLDLYLSPSLKTMWNHGRIVKSWLEGVVGYKGEGPMTSLALSPPTPTFLERMPTVHNPSCDLLTGAQLNSWKWWQPGSEASPVHHRSTVSPLYMLLYAVYGMLTKFLKGNRC